jgi:hypothetical protein
MDPVILRSQGHWHIETRSSFRTDGESASTIEGPLCTEEGTYLPHVYSNNATFAHNPRGILALTPFFEYCENVHRLRVCISWGYLCGYLVTRSIIINDVGDLNAYLHPQYRPAPPLLRAAPSKTLGGRAERAGVLEWNVALRVGRIRTRSRVCGQEIR